MLIWHVFILRMWGVALSFSSFSASLASTWLRMAGPSGCAIQNEKCLLFNFFYQSTVSKFWFVRIDFFFCVKNHNYDKLNKKKSSHMGTSKIIYILPLMWETSKGKSDHEKNK